MSLALIDPSVSLGTILFEPFSELGIGDLRSLKLRFEKAGRRSASSPSVLASPLSCAPDPNGEALCYLDKGGTVSDDVEIDGAYFGGYVKPANHKGNRIDRRRAVDASGKRKVGIVTRERNGKPLIFVTHSETAAVLLIGQRVEAGSTIYADDAPAWNALHAKYVTKRINHSECYSDGEACANQAESFFSPLRRAEIGVHHHVAGPYLAAYAGEMDWREDNRQISNGEQYLIAAHAALIHAKSTKWCGYWQRA